MLAAGDRTGSLVRIESDDLTRPEVHALLAEHLAEMFELSPPDKVSALDLERLRAPDVAFWTVWEDDLLLACGALKAVSPTEGEVKSMRTPKARRRRGAARGFGFDACGPFGSYRADPNSVFMSLRLASEAT